MGSGPHVQKCKVQNLAYLNIHYLSQSAKLCAIKYSRLKRYITSYDSSTLDPGPRVQKYKVKNLAFLNTQHTPQNAKLCKLTYAIENSG